MSRTMDDWAESELHPAALVFRNEVIGGLGQENSRLEEEISRLQPLLSYLKTIEVKATTNEEAIRMVETDYDGSMVWMPNASAQRNTVATVSLSDGSVVDSGNGEELHIPIEGCYHKLLLENLGFVGGVGLSVSGKTAWFPQGSARNGGGRTNVSVARDDTVYLTISVDDELSIQGEITGLNNQDHVKFVEGVYGSSHFDGYLMTPPVFSQYRIFDGSGVTFAPNAVIVKLTPSVRETLGLVKIATSEPSQEMSPSQQLRALTVAALGSNDQKALFDTNKVLSLQRDALLDIRAKALRVDLFHGEEALSFSLEEGEMTVVDDKPMWVVPLDGKEGSTVAVDDLGQSVLHVSGARLNDRSFEDNLRLLRQHFSPEAQFDIVYEGNHGYMLPYLWGIQVLGVIDDDDLTDDEHLEMTHDFLNKMWRVFGGGQPAGFPRSFKIRLKEARFHPSASILSLAGLHDESED